MASSRPTSSPEAELRHWLQDLMLESSVEETGKDLKRTPTYCLAEVSVGGSLSAVAVKSNDRAGGSNGHIAQRDEDEDHSDITARITDECHRYARLRHPNILQFLGVSFPQTSFLPVIVIERLDFTLSQCLSRFTKLPDYLRFSVLLDVAQGLHYMHDNSPPLAHGEIEASNIFLTSNLKAKLSYPPVYKLFTNDDIFDNGGVSDNHHSSAFTGIAHNNGGNCKEDVFAYGELMTHIITHKKPRRIYGGHSPSLLQQMEHVDSSHTLRGLIMQCLQKDPVLRPSTGEIVQEMMMAIPNHKSPLQDPAQILNAILEQPQKSNGSPKGSPPANKLKKLELENSRLTSQLKVTQSELRHLRMQQTLYGKNNLLNNDDDDEDEDEIEMKDCAVQVDILQDSYCRVYIELRKETSDQSLGFSIAGGKGTASTIQEGDHGIYITRIATDGLAEKDGRLKIGDKIISVNGDDLSSVSRADALTILMKSDDVCAMVVSRQELVTDTVSGLPPRRLSSIKKKNKESSSKSGKLHPLKLGVSIGCEVCSTLPEALTDGQAVLYRGKIIVGGQYSKNCGAIFEYDPEEDTWNTLATSPTWFYALAVFQDKVTVVGGFDVESQNCSAKLHAWNEREGSWMASLPSMPTARMHSSAISLGSSLVVAGGRNNKSTLNCIEVFNFASQQWYSAHPLMLEQSSMKSICHNGFWFLLGGEQQGFASPRALYTPLQSLIDSSFHKQGSVSCFKAIPRLPNTYSAVTMLGGKIILIGGTSDDSESSNKIYALTEDPMAWLEVGELPVSLTHGCAVAISDQEALIIGGRCDDGNDINDVFRIFLQESSNSVATTPN